MLDFLCTLPTDTSQAAANQPVKKRSSKRTAATGESLSRVMCVALLEDNNLYSVKVHSIHFDLIPLFIVVLWFTNMETVPVICHLMIHVFLSRLM